MSEQPINPITLNINYGNGVQKTFTNLIPTAQEDISIADVLDMAANLRPGLSYTLFSLGIDRGGRSVGQLNAVDGINANWSVQVNGKSFPDLRLATSESVTKKSEPSIQAGDEVKLNLLT